ncbi:hypothetical protein SAMN04515671_3879 [Nakamurella panacisegetis]|uniref:DUF309 domain-containing protein n=1 Tax=Nakamurella panacisegetis TaxID=1090615 RepID=A0A1H0S2X3_9ACTN|nr:DUF309 domain-containing protein [Nakamurella panacisegetis]SDP36060.1 hypothetical protein SAMN04515671_3879 [Nakamurella panacisegetis]
MTTSGAGARDRDQAGTARNARPRDKLGRPLPYGTAGVARQPEGVRRTPVETLLEAQRLLDDGYPFHAHEVFEDAWKLSDGPEREWWKALAQFAVGVTHLARGNTRGAVALLQRSSRALEALPGIPPFGIDAAAVRAWSTSVVDALSDGSTAPAGLPAAPRVTAAAPVRPTSEPAGDPVCWLELVCAGCGQFLGERDAAPCPRCGLA